MFLVGVVYVYVGLPDELPIANVPVRSFPYNTMLFRALRGGTTQIFEISSIDKHTGNLLEDLVISN